VPLSAEQISALYQLATVAGAEILTIYRDERLWQMTAKADQSPVTAADIRSSEILVAGLAHILACPVVSEEALPDYQERKDWPLYWLIDPMDGTREFLHRSDEFVINIALMSHQQPVFGLLYEPTTGKAWWGGEGIGAYAGTPAACRPLPAASLANRLVALGSRRSTWLGAWREQLTDAGYLVQTECLGSALKFARLAEGGADLYPRLGLTCEWDTAAPQAILAQTGGAIVQWNGQPLIYGKEDILNPHFIAVRDKSLLSVLTLGPDP
jgi:3'(2'), 5'-bisphosphate nucleotidase